MKSNKALLPQKIDNKINQNHRYLTRLTGRPSRCGELTIELTNRLANPTSILLSSIVDVFNTLNWRISYVWNNGRRLFTFSGHQQNDRFEVCSRNFYNFFLLWPWRGWVVQVGSNLALPEVRSLRTPIWLKYNYNDC